MVLTTSPSCCICGNELKEALPVKYWGKDAHMRCVDKKLAEGLDF